jgi:hypothetical protein
MENGNIVAPLLLKKVNSIKTFYKKIKEVNPTSNTEDIFAFIKKFHYICAEPFEHFKREWMLNMFYTTAPLYLKGYNDEQVKDILLETDEYIATAIQYGDDYFQTDIEEDEQGDRYNRVKHRTEVTEQLLKQLTS